MKTIKKILCPVDCSEPSVFALHRARDLARHFDAELILVYVISPHGSGADPVGFGAGAKGDLKNRMIEAYTGLMGLVSEELPTDIGITAEVLAGDPAEEIIARTEKGVDVIVMSTHGRSGWKRLVFGSVTNEVLRSAPCPVMTVAWREEDELDSTHRRIHELVTHDHPGEAFGAARTMHLDYLNHRHGN